METLLFTHSTDIKAAAELLKQGELVAFPTETVYGLGALIFNPEAIAQIFTVKGRPQDNPLIAHISHLSQIELIATEPPPEFYLLAEHFFPGPLTLVLNKHASVPPIVSGGGTTIAVRMPSHPIALALIEAVGMPIVAPSANLSGKPSSTRLAHVMADFNGKIAAVLDGGNSEIGIESTVLSLVHETPIILRPGKIKREDLEEVLGRRVNLANTFESGLGLKPISPGMKYRHYAPLAKILLFDREEDAYLHYKKNSECSRIIRPTAESLYSSFRDADSEGIKEILIICDSSIKSDSALYNRILKASH